MGPIFIESHFVDWLLYIVLAKLRDALQQDTLEDNVWLMRTGTL